MRAARRTGLAASPMSSNGDRSRPGAASGAAVGLVGIGLVGAGLWARRDVARTLARERIVFGPDREPVVSATAARSLAESIRASMLETTGGHTYSETPSYLGVDGEPTSDASLAAREDGTGHPVENPHVALWLQATTLQTALMQAYLAFRLAELTAGLGASLAIVGAGLAARRRA
jgi:hypothetical protein